MRSIGASTCLAPVGERVDVTSSGVGVHCDTTKLNKGILLLVLVFRFGNFSFGCWFTRLTSISPSHLVHSRLTPYTLWVVRGTIHCALSGTTFGLFEVDHSLALAE